MWVFPHCRLEKKCSCGDDRGGQDGSGPPVASHGTSDMCRRTIMSNIQPNYFGFVTKSQAVSWSPAMSHVNTHHTASKSPGDWRWVCALGTTTREHLGTVTRLFLQLQWFKPSLPMFPSHMLCNCQREHRSVEGWFPQAVPSPRLSTLYSSHSRVPGGRGRRVNMLIVAAASEAPFNNLCMLSADRKFGDLVNTRIKGHFRIGSWFLFIGIIFKAARRKTFKSKIHLDLAQI